MLLTWIKLGLLAGCGKQVESRKAMSALAAVLRTRQRVVALQRRQEIREVQLFKDTNVRLRDKVSALVRLRFRRRSLPLQGRDSATSCLLMQAED